MIKRFPIEPSSEAYTPNEYNINSAGYPCYNTRMTSYETSTDIYLENAEYSDGVMNLIRSDGHEIQVEIGTEDNWFEGD